MPQMKKDKFKLDISTLSEEQRKRFVHALYMATDFMVKLEKTGMVEVTRKYNKTLGEPWIGFITKFWLGFRAACWFENGDTVLPYDWEEQAANETE